MDIKKLFKKVKYDKLPKEWENYAKWQYMSFFLETIIISLDYMINEGHGYPAKMTSKRWKDILEEMKEGFILAQNKINYEQLKKKEEKKVKKSFDLFKKHFFSLWD